LNKAILNVAVFLVTESTQLEARLEELADQKLSRTVLARMDELDQAIEVNIDTMSVIGLAEAVEEKPH
jgi:hypothetical protein